MSSGDTPSFAGSSILRQSPPFDSSSHTGPGGADLSLSELYISDRLEDTSVSEPFTLLPPRRDGSEKQERPDEDDAVFSEGDNQVAKPDGDDLTLLNKEKRSLSEDRTREERLQHDLYVLKKLNVSLSLYNDALTDTRSSTENVALQLDRTDRLLDQYVNLLQHTERNSKLIFDETWEGGAADQDILERLRVEAIQKAEREREERQGAARLEQERQEREEQERKTKEERDSREKDKRGSASVRGVRGVRGLRARGVSAAARGRIPSASTTTTKRGVSEISTRDSTVPRGGRRS